MKTNAYLLLLVLASCAVGRQGVYFNEMPVQPLLRLDGNMLTVKTSNSIKNSALLIYQIHVSVNQSKKEVYLSADQAEGKSYRDTFTINLSNYKIIAPATYSFYWLDPNKKKIRFEPPQENK